MYVGEKEEEHDGQGRLEGRGPGPGGVFAIEVEEGDGEEGIYYRKRVRRQRWKGVISWLLCVALGRLIL